VKLKWAGNALCALAAAAVVFGFCHIYNSGGNTVSGSASPQSVRTVSVQTDSVQYYFPRANQDAQKALLHIMDSSAQTLDVAVYSITDGTIASAMVRAKLRGVTVRLLTDSTQSAGKSQKTLLAKIKSAGIPIKTNSHSGLMHLKMTVADKKIATTGSFNYTKSAQKSNDEVFVVLNNAQIATGFDSEFETMWNDTKNYAAF
jgi:phosphatidylserine/phosphatidylglycerophosphate/cardiolipin synthase-like enzyme